MPLKLNLLRVNHPITTLLLRANVPLIHQEADKAHQKQDSTHHQRHNQRNTHSAGRVGGSRGGYVVADRDPVRIRIGAARILDLRTRNWHKVRGPPLLQVADLDKSHGAVLRRRGGADCLPVEHVCKRVHAVPVGVKGDAPRDPLKSDSIELLEQNQAGVICNPAIKRGRRVGQKFHHLHHAIQWLPAHAARLVPPHRAICVLKNLIAHGIGQHAFWICRRVWQKIARRCEAIRADIHALQNRQRSLQRPHHRGHRIITKRRMHPNRRRRRRRLPIRLKPAHKLLILGRIPRNPRLDPNHAPQALLVPAPPRGDPIADPAKDAEPLVLFGGGHVELFGLLEDEAHIVDGAREDQDRASGSFDEGEHALHLRGGEAHLLGVERDHRR
eukprot:Sdes_comp10553_c0_seq1m2246